MNVLIWIVNLSSSFGEITNALQFARELANEGINVYYYKSSSFVQNYLYLTNKQISFLDKDDIKKLKFDLVLFSEYLYLFRAKVKYLNSEIAFIKENFINKVKIGTIDSYQLANYIKEGKNGLFLDLPDSRAFENVILPAREYFFTVSPCPLGYPVTGKKSTFPEYFWLRPFLHQDQETGEKIRNIFQLEPESKRVFLPLSKWQHLFWGGKIDSVKDFTLKLADYFTFLFDSLALDIPYSFFFGVPSPEFKKFKNKNFSSFFFNPDAGSYIPPADYDQFLAGTDLILTLHIIQNSFIRAVVSGTPGINLTHNVKPVKQLPLQPDFFLNNIRLDSSGIIGYDQERIDANPFLDIFKSFEILDENLKNYLRQIILNGKTSSEQAAFEIYQRGLSNCLKAGEIARAVIS
jgi:hypothetical protein